MLGYLALSGLVLTRYVHVLYIQYSHVFIHVCLLLVAEYVMCSVHVHVTIGISFGQKI